MVEELRVNYRRPIAGQVQFGGSVGGKDEVLGGYVIPVAPLDTRLQVHFGGPIGLTLDGFLPKGRWEIRRKGGYPVKSLIGVGV